VNPIVKPERPRRRALLAIAAIAIVATAAGIAGVRQRPDAGPGTANGAAALEFAASDLYTVERARLARSLPLTGSLMPLIEATVKAKVPGELTDVPVREGESARRGQVLARVDVTEVQARVAARAADVEAARAQLVLAEKNQSTQKALLDRKFISQNAFDTTWSAYQVAAARLRAAEAELAVAHKSLGDAVLVAPFDGVVSKRHARPGERVAIDAPVVTLVDLARLELEASVPAASIAEVEVGQRVAFRVDGFGERTFEGRIERINPSTVAGSRSIALYASLNNPDGSLRGGMFAHGELVLEQAEAATVVPLSAVREESGERVVYALIEGQVRRRPVTIGEPDASGRVPVLSGIEPGVQIVRANLGALRDGAPARVAAGGKR